MTPRGRTLLLLAASVLQLAAGVAAFLTLGPHIESQIRAHFAVQPDSELYDIWRRPPVKPLLKIWVFNLTNLPEWLSGAEQRLSVRDVGPYVYEETWAKVRVEHAPDDDAVSYDMVKRYRFMPELTDGDLDEDVVTVPNIPLFSAGFMMRDADPMTLMGFRMAIDPLNTTMFQVLSIRQQ